MTWNSANLIVENIQSDDYCDNCISIETKISAYKLLEQLENYQCEPPLDLYESFGDIIIIWQFPPYIIRVRAHQGNYGKVMISCPNKDLKTFPINWSNDGMSIFASIINEYKELSNDSANY